jgi:hypothetical protein
MDKTTCKKTPRYRYNEGINLDLLQRFGVSQEFHNGIPGLLCLVGCADQSG